MLAAANTGLQQYLKVADCCRKVLAIKSLEGSRLILKKNSFRDHQIARQYHELFRNHGITESRIKLIPWTPNLQTHLDLYNRIDLALDTFPYNGTTTTFEALWMGVPVVTLAGNQHAGRVGVSILSNTGLEDLVANTHDEYVNLAVQLANDVNRLETLRSGLRFRLQKSCLCNAAGFTHILETAFRTMWQRWCGL